MPEDPDPAGGPAPADQRLEARSRAVTPLLTLITQQSLDEDYAHVARRRSLDQPRPARGRPQRTAAAVVAVFGLLATTAAVQTAQGADEAQASRSTLVARVTERRDTVAALTDRSEELRTEIEAGEAELSRVTGLTVSAQSRLRRLQIRTGYIAVTGEGARVTMTDAAGAPEDGELIRDTDLQLLVNGLWQAGAEAISINGQRVTVRTAIKNSDVVINVNSQPLRPPYVVNAIGDRRTLQADLLASASGLDLANLVSRYGFGFEMVPVEELVLPAAPDRVLRHATLLSPDEPRADTEEAP
jgi:uncharacterized protein YlxW (UPF0749 family)